MPTKRDYYDVLGVAKTATAAEIKSAYRKSALKYHPDRNKEADAETKFKEINEAYQILSDDQKRQTYDQFGHAAFDPAMGGANHAAGGAGGNPFAGFGGQNNPFTWSYTTNGGQSGGFEDFDFGDPFEIFNAFFGGGYGGAGRGARRSIPTYSLRLTFLEAVHGIEKEVEIDGKPRRIKIPAGVNDGTRIKFDDFNLAFDVGTDPYFKRDGADVYVDVAVPYSTLILGDKVVVKTLKGDLKLKVRPGTPSHTMIRLSGEGIKRLQGSGYGDMYVRFVVVVPERVSGSDKKVLEQLKKAGF